MVEKVLVPDVGEAEDVEVIEILVKVGDTVQQEASLIVLESDKASMEVPSPIAGKVVSINVSEGDTVEQGDLILEIELAEADSTSDEADADSQQSDADEKPADEPDVDASDDGEQGGGIEPEDEEENAEEAPEESEPPEVEEEAPKSSSGDPADQVSKEQGSSGGGEDPDEPKSSGDSASSDDSAGGIHAGPAVRKQAREYGVRLSEVKGSGKHGRILKEDVQQFVAGRLKDGGGDKAGIPAIPVVDFTRFGEIEHQPLPRIRQVSARNLHRSWLNVPHVTQFDEADITELEAFRSDQNRTLKEGGVKLTPLAFLIKASVAALKAYPQFNASITPDYKELILKKYFNIGIAVETEQGLVVPVIKDADGKGVIELAGESAALAARARDRKLTVDEMQGATFTISSLGGIGGTMFTPIVNAPEVAILGASRSKVSPVWDGEQFVPRTMLPLSLSYDHRAIDGAEAARFSRYLASVLTDLRRLIL